MWHPELSLEEANTAKDIADLVRSWGYEVVEGIGRYGVVASLTAGKGAKSIGLRADTDALPIQEDNDLPYMSDRAAIDPFLARPTHARARTSTPQHCRRDRQHPGARNHGGRRRCHRIPVCRASAGGMARLVNQPAGRADEPALSVLVPMLQTTLARAA